MYKYIIVYIQVNKCPIPIMRIRAHFQQFASGAIRAFLCLHCVDMYHTNIHKFCDTYPALYEYTMYSVW